MPTRASFFDNPVVRFLSRGDPLSFCVKVLVLLPLLALLTLAPWFDRLVQEPLVHLNALLTHWSLRAIGVESRLQSPMVHSSGFSVVIIPGCTGLFTLLILFSIIVAFPARWSSRVLGFVAGAFLIGSLNVIRLVSLILLGSTFPQLFDEVHLFVWQAITIIIALAFWFFWARRALRRLESSGGEAAAGP